MDRLLAPHHPSHMAGPPEWMKKGAACISAAKPGEFGWLMHPLQDCLHPDKGSQKAPMEGKVSWQISSSPLHSVWESPAGVRWRILLIAPPLPGHGKRR